MNNRALLTALGAVLAIIIGFIAPALSIPDAVRPVLWIVGALLLVAFFFVMYSSSRPEQPSNFLMLWPKLSESLHKDITDSLQSIQEAIRAAQPDYIFPVENVGLPNFQLYNLHVQTINGYDPALGKILKNYVQMARSLREAKNAYNQLTYQDQADQNQLANARSQMYKVSRDLERLIDEQLQPLVTRYDNEVITK